MGLGNAFDRVMDWTMEGNMAWSMTKFFGVAAVGGTIVLGAIALPILYIASQNVEDMNARFNALDQRPSVVFNSVAACTAKGYTPESCDTAQKEAISIAKGLGTEVSYSSGDECNTAHNNSCTKVTTQTPIYTTIITGCSSNGACSTMQIPAGYVDSTSYYPKVFAWQASEEDLSQSVPLYQGRDAQTLVRGDGMTFTAPAGP